MLDQNAQEVVFFSGRVLFLLMKQRCASPATELLEFFEEMERNFLKKNTQ